MASPEITLTHLDEPLFDGADATKRDLVDYLEAVGDRMISVLSGRPLSVVRVRAGQRPFMQKNVPDYAPPWIKTVSVWAESSHREVRYALCEDKQTLLWFANQRAEGHTIPVARVQAMHEGKRRARAQRTERQIREHG
jgi:bifunctional non-homologous end joining protein LigD